jgi:hypothetical protein
VRKSSLNNTSAVGTPALQNNTVQVRYTPRILKRVVIPQSFGSKKKGEKHKGLKVSDSSHMGKFRSCADFGAFN